MFTKNYSNYSQYFTFYYWTNGLLEKKTQHSSSKSHDVTEKRVHVLSISRLKNSTVHLQCKRGSVKHQFFYPFTYFSKYWRVHTSITIPCLTSNRIYWTEGFETIFQAKYIIYVPFLLNIVVYDKKIIFWKSYSVHVHHNSRITELTYLCNILLSCL